MDLRHVPPVLSYFTGGDCGTQGCLGRWKEWLQGTSETWGDRGEVSPIARDSIRIPACSAHPILLSLQPVGLPRCVRLCHRCASLCVTGVMQPPGADPRHLRRPIQTFSFKPS